MYSLPSVQRIHHRSLFSLVTVQLIHPSDWLVRRGLAILITSSSPWRPRSQSHRSDVPVISPPSSCFRACSCSCSWLSHPITASLCAMETGKYSQHPGSGSRLTPLVSFFFFSLFSSFFFYLHYGTAFFFTHLVKRYAHTSIFILTNSPPRTHHHHHHRHRRCEQMYLRVTKKQRKKKKKKREPETGGSSGPRLDRCFGGYFILRMVWYDTSVKFGREFFL